MLLLEDLAADAELVVHELEQAGFDPSWRRVDNEPEFLRAIESPVDLVLSDFNMPALDAARALALLRRRDRDLPFIVVSGSIGEETAVQLLKSGVTDYLLKDRLGRLGEAVRRAIGERGLVVAKRDAERALAATEERMRFALEASRVGTWELDFSTGSVHWSPTLEALHGLAPGAFAGTLPAFLGCVHPEDRAAVEASIERGTREHTDANLLYRTAWPDGREHWISGTGRTFYDQAGRPIRAAGIALDVTERRSLEEQYRQAQKMEAIGRLAGGVAHDFNNLLTSIQGYALLIAEALGADHPVQDDLQQVRRAADRATSLTHQLLAFSRRQILDPRVIDLRESIKAIEPMLRRLIGEHIDVTVRAGAELGRVKADPGQIEQVIMNLALNARDAMPDGGTLLVEAADATVDQATAHWPAGTTPGSYVMLAVTDTGEGIDPATQARIFEPFFTTKQQGKGTGLGLSTVYGIVTQSGGTISVRSEVGRGSTFTVYLPRVDEPVEPVDVPPIRSSVRGSETILVVEDEESVRELVRKALGLQGYRVMVASTPREAIGIARRAGAFHLLISDVVLPQMSGRDLASQIVAIRPGVRVLYMSGYTDHAIVERGILERGTAFLQKPFTPPALAAKVREMLG